MQNLPDLQSTIRELEALDNFKSLNTIIKDENDLVDQGRKNYYKISSYTKEKMQVGVNMIDCSLEGDDRGLGMHFVSIQLKK